jgi:hypothetical protein
MNITLIIAFFLAMCGSAYFIGRLATWMVFKISPQNCKRKITNKDVLTMNIVVFVSILLWTFIFSSFLPNFELIDNLFEKDKIEVVVDLD